MTTDFFVPSRRFTVGDVARLVGASLSDGVDESAEISGLAKAEAGGVGTLVFVEGRKHAALLKKLSATAVICTPDLVSEVCSGTVAIAHRRPQLAFARVGRVMFPASAIPGPLTAERGVSPHATVDPSAMIEDGAIVEAGAVIGPNAAIGAGTVVAPNAAIGHGCKIGRNGYVGPGASVQYALIGDRVTIHGGARIGQDGFGFVFGEKGPERMPQLGRVIIQDDVEIGANSTVDRGALDDTIIGEATKIDNLVQVAHNVKIGRGCVIAGHCGLSGSVTLGDYVMLGGRVGIADHVTIGSRVQIAAASGVMDNIPDDARWAGAPAVPVRDFFRQVSAIRKLAGRKSGDAHE
ncbi:MULTISPECIES: UDP-3-O-(3-hydroxymyristoyl)glucosamine N-acyltransferase [Mesorhizobium]|uniref:UDP-3-O-acylglucosamine N-acyltransferase n=1 Tax=Mesorhizobium denitrificans TaxID=2294114 RepID=A0A371XDC6_9HYPH|nr:MULTISPECIES: UDP-3-O-(3-hydroxymyristoyl)glucosamine N-acyltransferase [Mesorhizobium]RFC67238.1 UDP-3-O-(3-hydroxymyristoyl)glucosamine N-acyltransferase [Mesorhizobium denitrificans]